MAKAVGIDLGTTNSVIATWEGGQPTVIPNAEGARTTPSVVAFTEQRRAARRPAGPAPGDPEPEGHDLLGQAVHRPQLRRGDRGEPRPSPSTSSTGPDGAARFEVRGKLYAPEEITALVLRKLAEDAGEVPRREGHRGGHHRSGVLQRRPAPGDQGRRADRRARGAADHQRADRGRAGLRAGQEGTRDRARLRPRRRHVRRQHPRRRRRRGRGARPPSGDTHLGGDDFDRRIVDHLADEFQKENGIDLRSDPQALQRLFEAAEKAKVELSARSPRRRSTCRSSPPTPPGPST